MRYPLPLGPFLTYTAKTWGWAGPLTEPRPCAGRADVPAVSASKFLVTAGWEDAPHLDAQTKADMLRETPPYLRKARSEGVPSIGAGAIYPVEADDFLVDPFPIPDYFRRCFALDVGWNRTAALWGAHDLDTDTVYLTSEHYRGQAEPPIHAAAIKARGEWIPGVIDPASRGRNQVDGRRLFSMYRGLGLTLHLADNAVEAGIYAVWERLSTGKLKVFRSLQHWRREHMFYRRDEKGAIVKKDDHLMDCTRYLLLSGLSHAIVRPVQRLSGGHHAADARAGY